MNLGKLSLSNEVAEKLIKAIHDTSQIEGLTHDFYHYPACFSPRFAREVIKAFTHPGEVVLDPFMGAGTTLVEARALGRIAVGIDISKLATFLAEVKTTPLSKDDVIVLRRWANRLRPALSLRNRSICNDRWKLLGYQRHINNGSTWRIRNLLKLGLESIKGLKKNSQRKFARCVLLKTAQWALDCRKSTPSVEEFRNRLFENLHLMLVGANEFSRLSRDTDHYYERSSVGVLCLNRSTIGIEHDLVIHKVPPPRLILTSPPYPGVHVVYHRWQIRGRKETPAPFWVANVLDGHGESFYTFGSRKERGLLTYFETVRNAFKSISHLVTPATLVVQLIAFSDRNSQLRQYLHTMNEAGFAEVKILDRHHSSDGRIWRTVPNRKWYANVKGPISSSQEVVLFHRKH